MSDDRVRGRFVWHELMTLDVPAAISFYSKVVGWTTQSWEMDKNYTMFLGSNGPVGGVMVLPEEAKAMGAPPHWMTYIGTRDVDATVEHAESLGASVIRPPDSVPTGGRFAILRDPQGAVFSIYQPPASGPEPTDAPPVTGEMSWHELATTDLDGAFEFYSSLFGWEKSAEMDMGPEMGIYLIFGWNGTQQGGMYRKPDNMPAPPNWLPYAMIPDSKAAAAVITGNGGSVLMGPHEVPGGDWIVMGMDPQGVAFAVHSKGMGEMAPAPSAPEEEAMPAASPAKAAKPAAARKTAKKAARKPAKKKAAKKAARKAKKKAARKAPKRKAAPKPPRKKAARKVARKKAARKAARKKAARKTAKKKAARKTAKKKAARRAPRRKPAREAAKRKAGRKAPKKKAARRKPARRPAKRAARRARPRKRK